MECGLSEGVVLTATVWFALTPGSILIELEGQTDTEVTSTGSGNSPSDTNMAASLVSATRPSLASVSSRRKMTAPLPKRKGLDGSRHVESELEAPLATRSLLAST